MNFRPLVHGVTAGAVGTAVLNTVTYVDMVVRDRPSSEVPAETAERATDLVGVSLTDSTHQGGGGQGRNRQEALGALMGYATGYGVGAAYGVLRESALRSVPRSLAGIGIGIAATVATVIPYRALGVSDPATWPPKSWAADIIPHLCYGWATAAAFDGLRSTHDGT